jgi:hypothetical protein
MKTVSQTLCNGWMKKWARLDERRERDNENEVTSEQKNGWADRQTNR